MAKQAGIFPLTGTIGGATFYKHPDDGFLVRQYGGPNRERMFRDPIFKNTLRNAEEFRRATQGAAQLRYALSSLLKPVADGKLNGRMNAVFLKTVQSDKTSAWGQRCLLNGAAALPEGFNFNQKARLANVFRPEYSGSIDPVTGDMQVAIPSFIPKQSLVPPPGAVYFQVLSIGCSLDFIHERPKSYVQQTGLYPIDHQPVPALELAQQVSTEAGQFLFLVLGIVFYAVPADIPRDFLSRRKRQRLGNGENPVAYTGSAMVLNTAVAAGPSNVSDNG